MRPRRLVGAFAVSWIVLILSGPLTFRSFCLSFFAFLAYYYLLEQD